MRRRSLILALVASFAVVQPACADPVSDRIYPAPRLALSLEGLPAETRLISITTRDGLTLQGLEVTGRSDFPVLMVLHGNASSAADTIRRFRPAIARGYGVVAAEYRGYSANPGRPGEAALADDADAFMAHARTTAGTRPVWIVGHSLGAGVGLPLALRSPPQVMVTIGAFTRLRDMVSGLTRAVVPNAYRNQDVVGRLGVPYFLIHGTADGVVPATHGQALHRVASEADVTGASFVLVRAGHDPDGETVARILDAIRGAAADGQPSAAGLPDTIKRMPFGRTPSVDP